jgi:SAM-dependent methyltransferase
MRRRSGIVQRVGTGASQSSLDPARALAFGAAADDYQRWRPGYPPGAVAFVAPEAPATVLDLGAGTGQLVGPLLQRGLHVHAVDRDPEMVRVLHREYPAALAQVAGADRLPYGAGSLGAVVVGTAFHWFPFEAAVAEIRRVLRPEGWLGVLYNLVRPVASWELELVEVDPDRKGAEDGLPDPSWPFPGGSTESVRIPWDWEVTPEHFRNCLGTHSALLRMDASERRTRLDAAERIVRRACDEHERSTAPIHHEAFCLRWHPEL